jgi:hypothetical protein
MVIFGRKKKFGNWICVWKVMVLKGVIVYSNFMKVGLGIFIFASLYGRPKKVISLSSPHRAMALPSTLPIHYKK